MPTRTILVPYRYSLSLFFYILLPPSHASPPVGRIQFEQGYTNLDSNRPLTLFVIRIVVICTLQEDTGDRWWDLDMRAPKITGLPEVVVDNVNQISLPSPISSHSVYTREASNRSSSSSSVPHATHTVPQGTDFIIAKPSFRRLYAWKIPPF